MSKDWYKSFLNSKRWKRCRESYIKKRIMIDGGMCEECGKEAGYIVHHKRLITPENITNPDISLNHENLEYVCKKCHDMFDGHGAGGHGKIKPTCIFDENGQPISIREVDRR